MSENVDRSSAERVLLAAFRMRCAKDDTISRDIKTVLYGTHKTYKYILVNGLLAKATNNKINPITLQSGANIKGAYDARSLCHNVLVPFERDFLQNVLGGSNEPFLNKPARFTQLSTENAVRKGNDKETLGTVISILSSISSSREAKSYLSCALEFLKNRIDEINELHKSESTYNPTTVEIYEFIVRFLEKSFEGETSAIIVATLEKLYYQHSAEHYEVIAHKVNQSGASSKEIGDIDVFKNGVFQYAIEVKDKDFTPYDLAHAFEKIVAAGGSKGEFIYGPNANFDNDKITLKLQEYEDKGFFTLLHDIFSYSRMMLFKTDLHSKSDFIGAIMSSAITINSKEATKKWIHAIAKELSWN